MQTKFLVGIGILVTLIIVIVVLVVTGAFDGGAGKDAAGNSSKAPPPVDPSTLPPPPPPQPKQQQPTQPPPPPPVPAFGTIGKHWVISTNPATKEMAFWHVDDNSDAARTAGRWSRNPVLVVTAGNASVPPLRLAQTTNYSPYPADDTSFAPDVTDMPQKPISALTAGAFPPIPSDAVKSFAAADGLELGSWVIAEETAPTGISRLCFISRDSNFSTTGTVAVSIDSGMNSRLTIKAASAGNGQTGAANNWVDMVQWCNGCSEERFKPVCCTVNVASPGTLTKLDGYGSMGNLRGAITFNPEHNAVSLMGGAAMVLNNSTVSNVQIKLMPSADKASGSGSVINRLISATW